VGKGEGETKEVKGGERCRVLSALSSQLARLFVISEEVHVQFLLEMTTNAHEGPKQEENKGEMERTLTERLEVPDVGLLRGRAARLGHLRGDAGGRGGRRSHGEGGRGGEREMERRREK